MSAIVPHGFHADQTMFIGRPCKEAVKDSPKQAETVMEVKAK
jgi:hypothetical protein